MIIIKPDYVDWGVKQFPEALYSAYKNDAIQRNDH